MLGEALQRALAEDNEVVVVSSAVEALTLLEGGERYDVVLCDVMMPQMDGIELHRRLSATLPHEAERVVFITGGVITARIDAFIARTSNLLLEKPVDVDGLRGLIERRVRAEDARATRGR
jgi:CheY-like chemotaxis protein